MVEETKTETADARMWRFGGWHLFLLCCAILYFGPITQTYSEQDSCSFGSVTNEEYRVMLREAKKDAPITLQTMNEFDADGSAYSYDRATFKAYFRKHVQNSDDIERMVAGMHAALRAIGAWHISSDFEYREKPYAGRNFYAGSLYGIGSQRMRPFRFTDIIFKYADVRYSIHRNAGSAIYELNSSSPGALFFSIKHDPTAGHQNPKQPCPVVPR